MGTKEDEVADSKRRGRSDDDEFEEAELDEFDDDDEELDDDVLDEADDDSDSDDDDSDIDAFDDDDDGDLDDEEDDEDDDDVAGSRSRTAARTARSSRATKTVARPKKKAKPRKDSVGPGILGRFIRFVREVVAELQKVIWPTRKELVTYTSVVIVFVAVMMTLVSLLDVGFAKAMFAVFGGKTVPATTGTTGQ